MSNPSDTILSFVPTFTVAPGEIARVQEGDTLALPIALTEVGTRVGYLGQTFIKVGNAVSLVATVTADGEPVAFGRQLDDQLITFPALTRPAALVVTLARPSGRFTLLNGALPPGLSLNANGLITGMVANITADPAEYRFGVRYTNDTHLRDRLYAIFASGIDSPAYFNPDQLAGQITDDLHPYPYKFLQTLSRGQGYAYTFDIYDPDGVLPGFVVTPITGFAPNTGQYGGLPDGLVVTNQTIEGAVAVDACPGDYFFRIAFKDAGHEGAVFMLRVTETVSPNVGLTPRVVWTTPAGSLGTIEETEPCYFEVAAVGHSTDAPTYALAPYSAPLPAGISLNTVTGRLYGVMPYVSSDTVFSFRLRATSGSVFADQDFSITVLDWFDLDSIHQLRLKMSITEEAKVSGPYVTVIDPATLYRPEDPSFGLITHPYIYLIKGLDGTRDLDAALSGDASPSVPLASPRLNADYNSRFKLLLGNHKYAYARDASGAVVYEVIYREMLDPLAKAGGFTVTNNIVASTPTQWPQSGLTPKYYFPNSLNNIRDDLILDIGFAMNDDTARHEVGAETHELMPLWMRSEQILGDPSTIPGYVPALIIAYLKPGTIGDLSVTITALMREGSIIVPPNKVYHFDKYYTTETAVSAEMTFDDQTGGPRTIIDSPDLVFDVVYGDVIKYLN